MNSILSIKEQEYLILVYELAIIQIQKIPNKNIKPQNTKTIEPGFSAGTKKDKINCNKTTTLTAHKAIRIIRRLPHLPAAYPMGIAESAEAIPTIPAAKAP